MVRVRSPGDPRLATPSRRTALPVYLDAISAPRRGALLGLFSDLSLVSVDTARYALSAHAGAWGAGAGARFSGVRPLRIQGLRTAEGSRDYRGIYDIVGNIDTHSSHIALSSARNRVNLCRVCRMSCSSYVVCDCVSPSCTHDSQSSMYLYNEN